MIHLIHNNSVLIKQETIFNTLRQIFDKTT